MKKLIVFVGDGGSGKTTLINELTKRYPERFKKLVTCTSRSPRIGEIAGRDYHFHTKDYFLNNPELVLVKQTVQGDFYGTRSMDLSPTDFHSLLTLRFVGVSRIVKLGLKNVRIAYISISEELKIARMRQRGDNEDMIRNRLKIDLEDRERVEWGSSPIIRLEAISTIDMNVARIVDSS
jgi:guanylate kinase